MRLFLALDLPPALAAAASLWVDGLAAHLGAARSRALRWTVPHQRHVTLHFLGSVEAERAAPLANRLAGGLPLAPFTVTLGSGGCFPRRGGPRVVWLGLTAEGTALASLHAVLAAQLQALSIPVEGRPLHPHVTIARVRADADRRLGPALLDWCATEHPPDVTAVVGHVTCYESRPAPNGSIYRALVRASLSAD